MTDPFKIPHKKTFWSYTETIFEICLMLTPILLLLWNKTHSSAVILIALPFTIWSIIPPILEWIFLLSSAPIMTLTKKGIHFYYPFEIGFVDWVALEGLATQKTHWKHFYRITFQDPQDIASHLPFFRRLLFHRIYRKYDLFIPQENLVIGKKEFFQAIQHYSNVAPDNVDI